MMGVMPLQKALDVASNRGLDLVEISPNAEPPVCKILDFGKYKFQLQKKEHDMRKKQNVVHVKEIKLRPTIDNHDYEVKLRSIKKFLNEGNKVKITLRFRGREVTHKEIGMELMQRILDATSDIAKTELDAKLEGRQIIMILAPNSNA